MAKDEQYSPMAKDMLNGSKHQATEILNDLSTKAKAGMIEARDQMNKYSSQASDSTMEFVRKYPLQTALGAAVFGFALGAIMKKGSKKK